MRKDLLPFIETHPEKGARQRFFDDPFLVYPLLSGHGVYPKNISFPVKKCKSKRGSSRQQPGVRGRRSRGTRYEPAATPIATGSMVMASPPGRDGTNQSQRGKRLMRTESTSGRARSA